MVTPLPHPEAVRAMAMSTRRQILGATMVIHVAGSLTVFTYLQQIYPASQAFDTPWLNDFLLLVLSNVVLAPIAGFWGHHRFAKAAAFAFEGRAPEPSEQLRILNEPWRMSLRPLVMWVIATIGITTAVLVRSRYAVGDVADLAQILLIGGVGASAIGYLATERAYRPLFAIALQGQSPAETTTLGIRQRLVLAWAVSSGIPLVGLALSPFRESGTSVSAIALLAVVGLLGGLFTISVVAVSIAEPLDELRTALGRVGDGDLTADVSVNEGGEVGQVQAGFNRMVTGLRERAELHELFSRHVGHEVAEHALAQGTGLGGEARRASVLFVDLIGSTAMAEVLPPGEVVATLNAFFQAVVDTVSDEGGWVNKFEGDGALCIFGVPGFQPDHEARALRSARRLHHELAALREAHPGLDAGIGVSTGTVVAGNVGTEERYEYTVIGRAVNEAARLTDLAKQRPRRVLAAASSVRAAGEERAHWADRGRVGLRGQQQPTAIFEPGVGAPATYGHSSGPLSH